MPKDEQEQRIEALEAAFSGAQSGGIVGATLATFSQKELSTLPTRMLKGGIAGAITCMLGAYYLAKFRSNPAERNRDTHVR